MTEMNPDIGMDVANSSAQPSRGEISAKHRDDRSASRRRILIVDDNIDAADSLHAVLTLQGHETYVAYRGADALEAFRMRPFDLALIDICMPGMDGYQLVHHMRAAGAALPEIVAVTGLADKASRRRAREAGFAHYLVKPYEIEALEAILERRTEPYTDEERNQLASAAFRD
jgi:CheY-like chemotaxis protein